MNEVLIQDFINALVALFIAAIPLAIYAFAVNRREGLSWDEIRNRAGLVSGPPRYWAYGGAFTVLAVVLVGLRYQWMGTEIAQEGSPLLRFVDLGLGTEAVIAALLYGMIGTGLWEEILFRGLIGGALFRRLSFWMANATQAMIFLLPHLLILFIEPGWWYFLIPTVFLMGIVLGWLRHNSGSILPCWLVHGGSNVAVALFIAVG